MNAEQLELILKQTGYPVANNCFETEQRPPYIAYLESSSKNFFADNTVYQQNSIWHVELYSRKRDTESERVLEKVLNQAEICWEKSKTYNKDEHYNQTIYEFEEMKEME